MRKISNILGSKALVIHGDATDEALLTEENVADIDMFVGLTNDDENNIMSALWLNGSVLRGSCL